MGVITQRFQGARVVLTNVTNAIFAVQDAIIGCYITVAPKPFVPQTSPLQWPYVPAHHSPCRVLVVDDHPVNRTLLVRLLQRSNFVVEQATNGSEALSRWQQWQPHLILMDLLMPNVDGYEATRLIRTAETVAPQPRTSIIALTADAIPNLPHQVHATGFDSIMTKPIRSDILFKLIASHLNLQYVYDTARCPSQNTSVSAQRFS